MKCCKNCGKEQMANNWVQSKGKQVGRLCKQCFNIQQLAKLHGEPNPVANKYTSALRPAPSGGPIPKYITDNVLKTPKGCWEWQGTRRTSGYGVIYFQAEHYGAKNNQHVSVHRHVMEQQLGVKLTPQQFVCHACDNPSCCNPAHLFIGSIQDNNADKVAKGRGNFTVKTKNGPRKLADNQAEILQARALGRYAH